MIVVPTCLKEQWEGEIHRFLRWGAFDLIPYQLNFREGPRKIVWDTIMAPRGNLKLSDKIILATITVSPCPRPRRCIVRTDASY